MPRRKPALENVRRPPGPLLARQFLITVEHASNSIPARYGNLGLSPQQLRSHITWDLGSSQIGRACAKALGCALHQGRYSRLFIDLNRSLHHRRLMARRSFSIPIPGNGDISREERERRIRLYYAPYRNAVLSDVRRIVRRDGLCVHLSIHSFTPETAGKIRRAGVGLLYDPQRAVECSLVRALMGPLQTAGFQVRRNYPYKGVSDGHTTHLRRVFEPRSYAGLEIEVNRGLLAAPRDRARVARQLAAVFKSLVDEPQ